MSADPHPETDPWRIAAVLLYARGNESGAYAKSRQVEEEARGYLATAQLWRKVQLALATLAELGPGWRNVEHPPG